MCFSPFCCALRPGHVPANDQVRSHKVLPDDHVLDRLAGTGHLYGVRQARPPGAVARPLHVEVRTLHQVLTRVGPSTSPGCVGPHVGWTRITSWPHPPWPAPAIRSAQRRHCCFGCDSTRNGETANLGDLMWLWVRSGVQMNMSFGFSRTPRMTRVLDQPIHSIARQSDFIVKGC